MEGNIWRETGRPRQARSSRRRMTTDSEACVELSGVVLPSRYGSAWGVLCMDVPHRTSHPQVPANSLIEGA